MNCKNTKCGAVLAEYQWGDGYCSKACMATAMRAGDRMSDALYDPKDPTGRHVIARNADEIDAMLEAMDADARLPRIIYHLRAGWSMRKIGREMRIADVHVARIVGKVAPKLLQRCGLRIS